MNKAYRTRKTVELVMSTLILISLSVTFYLSFFTLYGDIFVYFRNGYILTTVIYAFLLLIFLSLYGGFKLSLSKISDIVFSSIISLIITNIVIYLQSSLNANYLIDIWKMILCLFIQIFVAILFDIICWKVFYKIWPAKDTLLIYQGDNSSIKNKLLANGDLNFNIKQSIMINDDISYIDDLIKQYDYILLSGVSVQSKEKIVKQCYALSKSLFVVPSTYEIMINNASKLHMIDTPLFEIGKFGPSQISKIIKRVFDIILSSLAIIIISPILLICAISIKAHDHGPIFYKQVRLTQYGKHFEILKFRSMKVDAESNGIVQMAKENDDRITSVGKILRRFRLDELPQLINILKGDMSIVGPRPERPEIANEIYKNLPEFEYRLKVRAGLTGYAQVYGKYNTTLHDKLLLDLMYIENYSIILDIKIVLMTVKILFMKESTEGF